MMQPPPQQGEVPQPDANTATHMQEVPPSYDDQQGSSMPAGRRLGGGTNVIGSPTNPTHLSSAQGGVGTTYTDDQPQGGGNSSYIDNSTIAPPSGTSGYTSPSSAHASPAPPSYIQTSSVPANVARTPMDNIMQVFSKWSKKAEDYTGNVWNHLKTGPNIAETAWGKLSVGTKAMTEGGLENLFRQNFDVLADEHLLKTYACYLSTSTGPVAGTLYMSTHKLAFCSDRPLAIPKSPNNANGQAVTPPPSTKSTAAGRNDTTSEAQQEWCYYKVAVPITHLESVSPTENTQKKPPEKYIQVKTVDGHEFWFMGFVNYDKGVKNLQETLASRSAAGPTYESNRATSVGAAETTNEGNRAVPANTSGPTYDNDRVMPASTANPTHENNYEMPAAGSTPDSAADYAMPADASIPASARDQTRPSMHSTPASAAANY